MPPLPCLAPALPDPLAGSPCPHRLDLKDIPNAIRLVAPDLGVLVASSVCLGLCGRLAREAQRSQHVQELVRAMGGRVVRVLEGLCPLQDDFIFPSLRTCGLCKSQL